MTGKREEIVYKKRLPHQLWWTTTLIPPYKRCKYYFELQTEKEVWYFFEDGFLTEEQINMDGRMLQCFTVPWMNPADVNRDARMGQQYGLVSDLSGPFLQRHAGEEGCGYRSLADRESDK